MNKKIKILNKIFNIYLVIAFIALSLLSFIINTHVYFTIYLMTATLIQCYYIFHNKGKIIGGFSIHNHILYGGVNVYNKMYTSSFYSLYGAFLGLLLLLKGTNEQKKLDIKKTVKRLIIVLSLGILVFLIFNINKKFSIVLLLDLIIFIGNVCAGFLAVQQSKWQFWIFIPVGIIQIGTGIMLHEPVIIINSIVYLFSDILSIFKWNLEYKLQFEEQR